MMVVVVSLQSWMVEGGMSHQSRVGVDYWLRKEELAGVPFTIYKRFLFLDFLFYIGAMMTHEALTCLTSWIHGKYNNPQLHNHNVGVKNTQGSSRTE